MISVFIIFIIIIIISSSIYGDGLAQGFVAELGGVLVHNTIIVYVNKLTTLILLSYFSSKVFTLL